MTRPPNAFGGKVGLKSRKLRRKLPAKLPANLRRIGGLGSGDPAKASNVAAHAPGWAGGHDFSPALLVYTGDYGFLRFAPPAAKVMESAAPHPAETPSMKQLVALALLAAVVPTVHAGGSLKEARQLWLHGNYAEARQMYADLVQAGKDGPAAVVGLSKALQGEGQYDKALKVTEDGLRQQRSAELLARKAEVLYLLGRWDEAEKAAAAAIEANEKNYVARWVQGQILRDRGQPDKADEAFRWFIRAFNDNDIPDLDDLMCVGLAALERARLHHLNDQYQFVIDEIFNEAVKKDKDYWPALYEKGKLFLEKHNKQDAFRAFEKALTINPQAAEVLAGRGEMAAHGFEMRDAEDFADQALEINPSFTPALRLRADVFAFSGELDKASKDLTKARSINPREEETLARVGAALLAQRKAGDFKALVKEVEAYNPKPYTFYTELGSQLEGRKAFLEAEEYFKIAVKLQPQLPEAQAGLGLLYMRLGNEDTALKLLEAAHEADKFNVRVANTLKVLDHLKKYTTIQTDHFLLRYDPKNDEVLAKYMARYLEELYKEYVGLFNYRPEGHILIEVFSKHEMFSGRVVALPDLHTIGACTGRMFAMVSVHDTSKVIPKAFNWVRVLRHELVHVFNLEQTHFQVPHWFTEGLAVTHEGSFGTVPPPAWTALLAQKLHSDDLLNLDTVLLGFIRPRSPLQWQQAYAQSTLYVEYLTRTYGEQAVGKLLTAFGEGLETAPALQKVLGVTKADFEKGYRAFLADRVKDVPVHVTPKAMSVKAMEKAHAANPQDIDLTARLAERYMQLGRRKQAVELADSVLHVKRNQPLALYVKALALIDGSESDLAFTLLENNTGDDTKDAHPLKLLGKLQFDAKKYTDAAQTYERCRKLEPFETAWLSQLAKVYLKTENREKMVEIFQAMAKVEPDDLLVRRKLAQHYFEAKDMPQAERYGRMGLEIDVLDRDCQTVLLQALDAQGKDAEAKELRTILGR
jgi:cellulose synthase operon protein C